MQKIQPLVYLYLRYISKVSSPTLCTKEPNWQRQGLMHLMHFHSTMQLLGFQSQWANPENLSYFISCQQQFPGPSNKQETEGSSPSVAPGRRNFKWNPSRNFRPQISPLISFNLHYSKKDVCLPLPASSMTLTSWYCETSSPSLNRASASFITCSVVIVPDTGIVSDGLATCSLRAQT